MVVLKVVVPLLVLLSGCSDPLFGGDRAVHQWTLELDPFGEDAYALDVPFLVGGDVQLERLRDSLRVVSGDATFT